MASEASPSDAVRPLLRTDLVTPPTHIPQFFTASEFATLTAVDACLRRSDFVSLTPPQQKELLVTVRRGDALAQDRPKQA